jgi:hypothetical protein
MCRSTEAFISRLSRASVTRQLTPKVRVVCDRGVATQQLPRTAVVEGTRMSRIPPIRRSLRSDGKTTGQAGGVLHTVGSQRRYASMDHAVV